MVDWPLDSNMIRRGSKSNTFGPVRRNSAGKVRQHQGWDFFAPVNTPCFAIADGTVARIYVSKDYGNVLVTSFRHKGHTRFAAYAHMGIISVKVGQPLTRGEPVGFTGSSGNAGGMRGLDEHLHFEIRTEVRPGLGLSGRLDPFEIYGTCPLKQAVRRAA